MIGRPCEEIEARLAAGEVDDDLRLHLTTCAGCAGLARDVDRLRRAATALPRPPLAAVAVAAHPTRRWRWVVVGAAVVAALVIGQAALRGRRAPAEENGAVDLVRLYDEAHQLWAPPGEQQPWSWLKYSTDSNDDSGGVIDPTTPLSATALLLDEVPRGTSEEATATPTGPNQTRRR